MIAYLLASLPTPRLGAPLAATPEAFMDACGRILSEARTRELASAFAPTVDPADAADAGAHDPEPPLGPTARAWSVRAAFVDDAVVRARAARTGRDPHGQVRQPAGYRVDVVEAVARAFDAPDPGDRERALDALRWRLADELAATEPAGFAALFARAVQLRLAARHAAWSVDAGWAVLEAALRRLERPLEDAASGVATHG